MGAIHCCRRTRRVSELLAIRSQYGTTGKPGFGPRYLDFRTMESMASGSFVLHSAPCGDRCSLLPGVLGETIPLSRSEAMARPRKLAHSREGRSPEKSTSLCCQRLPYLANVSRAYERNKRNTADVVAPSSNPDCLVRFAGGPVAPLAQRFTSRSLGNSGRAIDRSGLAKDAAVLDLESRPAPVVPIVVSFVSGVLTVLPRCDQAV